MACAYPALDRLEETGTLGSSWSQNSGRQRRVYVLTPAGKVALQAGAVRPVGF